MRFLRFAVPASIPAVILVGHAIAACGGSSSNPPGNNGGSGEDATPGSGQDSSSTTPSGDSSAPSSGGDSSTPSTDSGIVIPDGGFVLPPVEAGSVGTVLPSAPGVVQCGEITCDVDANTCCANGDGGTSCVAGTTTTCPQASIHCAQAADCPANEICCATFKASTAGVSAETSCQAGPCGTDQQTPPGAQLCALGTNECPNGSPCTKQSCEGETLQLCGLFVYSGIVNVSCTAE